MSRSAADETKVVWRSTKQRTPSVGMQKRLMERKPTLLVAVVEELPAQLKKIKQRVCLTSPGIS
jgi:hypothetical protein